MGWSYNKEVFMADMTKDGVETEIFRQIRNAETEIRNDFEI